MEANTRFLTDDGCVPARKDCPFRAKCEIAGSGNCLQRGLAQGASVVSLIVDEHFLSIVRKLPSAVRAVAYLDKSIAAHIATVGVSADGHVELGVNTLMEDADAEGLTSNQVQFVLNGLGDGNCEFGGRDSQGQWLNQASVLSILRGVARQEPTAELAAEDATALYRLAAFHSVEFSCAAARGFELTRRAGDC